MAKDHGVLEHESSNGAMLPVMDLKALTVRDHGHLNNKLERLMDSYVTPAYACVLYFNEHIPSLEKFGDWSILKFDLLNSFQHE